MTIDDVYERIQSLDWKDILYSTWSWRRVVLNEMYG